MSRVWPAWRCHGSLARILYTLFYLKILFFKHILEHENQKPKLKLSPPSNLFPSTHFWEGGGAFVVVGKPVTTLQRNKKNV